MDGHKMQWRNNLRIDEFFQVSKKRDRGGDRGFLASADNVTANCGFLVRGISLKIFAVFCDFFSEILQF